MSDAQLFSDGDSTSDTEGSRRPTENQNPPRTGILLSSRLGGMTFENAKGRHICLYYQDDRNYIYESTFLQCATDWIIWEPIGVQLVAKSARKETPIAAVNWANGVNRWLFYLDENNLLCEMTWDGSKRRPTWQRGPLTNMLIPALNGSDISADVLYPQLAKFQISLVYQDSRYVVRELQWQKDDNRPLSKGQKEGWLANHGYWKEAENVVVRPPDVMPRTSLAMVMGDGYARVFVQNEKDNKVQEFWRTHISRWYFGQKSAVPVPPRSLIRAPSESIQPPKVLALSRNPAKEVFFAFSNGKFNGKDPASHGPFLGSVSQIKEQFIVLSWANSEIEELHIFSLDQIAEVVKDYLLKGETHVGGELRLLVQMLV